MTTKTHFSNKVLFHKRNSSSDGFTIVELMISTVIFSLVMLICLTGMVQVSRAYYKGITHTRTQEATRILFEEISQTIQLSGSTIARSEPVNAGPTIPVGDVVEGTGVFCAGNKKYTYALDRKVSDASNEGRKEIKNAIISEDVKCSDVLTPADLNSQVTGSQRSLLGEDMRLTKFAVTPVIADSSVDMKEGSQLWRVEISVVYGDQDLLATDDDDNLYQGTYVDDFGNLNSRVICRAGTGAEFCSIVELSTIVSRRIGTQ